MGRDGPAVRVDVAGARRLARLSLVGPGYWSGSTVLEHAHERAGRGGRERLGAHAGPHEPDACLWLRARCWSVTELDGKVALVTGGRWDRPGGGRTAGRRGAAVVFCGAENRAELDRTARTGRVADVRRAGEMRDLVDRAVARFGGLDIVANCAGIQRYGTVEDTPRGTVGRSPLRQPERDLPGLQGGSTRDARAWRRVDRQHVVGAGVRLTDARRRLRRARPRSTG